VVQIAKPAKAQVKKKLILIKKWLMLISKAKKEQQKIMAAGNSNLCKNGKWHNQQDKKKEGPDIKEQTQRKMGERLSQKKILRLVTKKKNKRRGRCN
jgi:hypothetical protein